MIIDKNFLSQLCSWHDDWKSHPFSFFDKSCATSEFEPLHFKFNGCDGIVGPLRKF